MAFSYLPTRRRVLASAGATLASAAVGWPANALSNDQPAAPAAPNLITADGPFSRSTVTEIARALAKGPFVPPNQKLPDAISDLNYDQYRAIYFKQDAAIWTKEELPFRLQLFHRGFFFKDEIDIAVVKDGQAHHLAYSPDYYQRGNIVPHPLPTEDIGFAGLRIHGEINRPGYFDEIAVFQGASYFRSLGKGQIYGISARGLALKVGDPGGEEFPIFRDYWVETPDKESDSIVVHALLDSPSVAGAYRFTIRPGLPTQMDVEATLFPRVDLDKAGLAAGTSMFYFDANGREDFDDWRPEVHDSDGLLMINGRGEHIWRPLANPKTLQFSAFVDSAPRGFGLMQRDRNYDTYQDYNASYERRPSLWVEPVGDWGKGTVTLVEIPSNSETNDNIVAYWTPSQPIKAGSEFPFAYRLSWGNGPELTGVTVAATRRGRGDLKEASPIRRFVIDYAPAAVAVAANDPKPAAPAAGDPPVDPKATVTASGGKISDIWIEPNPTNNGWRLTFNLDPDGKKLVEIRATLTFADGRPAETWLYRWTA